VRQPERGKKPQRTLFMTENELKKLVNEAVSLHRVLTTYGERLKTLKGELIRSQTAQGRLYYHRGPRLPLDR
jgi:hypothetical protein